MKRNGPEHLPHAGITYDSFAPMRQASLSGVNLAAASLMLNEQRHMDYLAHNNNEDRRFVDIIKGIRKESVIQVPEAAKLVAHTEAAALINENPELLVFSLRFPSLYRLLRSLELTGNLKRNGETCLIGSADTIPEVLALRMQPPTDRTIEKFFRDHSSTLLVDKYNKTMQQTSWKHPLLQEGGKISAIEPEKEFLNDFDIINQVFGVPTDTIALHRQTLEAAMNGNTIPNNLDTILWHRADPAIFYGRKPPSRKERRAAKRSQPDRERAITDMLTPHLRPGGHFVLTVGAGNSLRELAERGLLIGQLRSALNGKDTTVIEPFTAFESDIVDIDHYRPFAPSPEYDAIGTVVARKK